MPHPPEPLVPRPRLERLLADGTRRQVTLVSGPPGAGKTTLLTTWLHAGPPRRAAWVTVHERDNERGHLARLVVEALVRVGAVPEPPAPGTSPAASGASGEVMLDAAFEQIMAAGTGCVLVLEDVHELRSVAALRTLAYLVERAPDPLDVVLSTRADPPISQGRLGLDGRLGQIRYADLAFTPDEAADLVAAHGVALGPDDVLALCQRMEGWAAGLKLAACALQLESDPHRFVADAAAARAAVSDYLLSEVLLRQDEATRDFLLRTSVVDRVTPDLAVALTGDPRSRRRLLDLEHRGLFLARLGGEGTYRYHALFRSLLRARLQQGQPDLVVELHRRAAGWHLAQGRFGDAEQHARAAGDWALAGQLLLQRWLQGTTTDGDPLADDPVAGVSPAVVLQTPELALMAATVACRWANRQEADLYRGALAEAEAAGALGTTWDARRRSVWRTARCLSDLTYGWAFGADARSRAAIASLRSLATTEAWTPRLRQLALLAQAEQDIDGGDLDHARRTLEELADEGDDAWHRVLASVTVAVLEAATGDLPAAEARVAAALAAAGERGAQPTVHVAHLAAALCAAQRGALRAETEALAASGGVLEWSSRSLRCVDRALRAAANGRAPFFVSLDAGTARHPLAGRALVALGVLEVVDAAGRPVAVGGPGERALAELRRRLREGSGDVSPDAVTSRLGAAPRHPRTLIEAGVLAAIAAHRRGDRAAAGHRLGDALDLATATGITAPLLAHGADLKGVLASGLDGLGARTASAFELLDRVQHTGPQAVVEPLTDREIEVLQHLPTLMSNVEIAEGMHLSVNTVKTHLKAVYRKLGVEGRREAVLRGRELELI